MIASGSLWRANMAVMAGLYALGPGIATAAEASRDMARRAAVHPVASVPDLQTWLAHVPATKDFPPDLAQTLRGSSSLFLIEMSTAPGCIPCADLGAARPVSHALWMAGAHDHKSERAFAVGATGASLGGSPGGLGTPA